MEMLAVLGTEEDCAVHEIPQGQYVELVVAHCGWSQIGLPTTHQVGLHWAYRAHSHS